jgi:hypothetical protein
LEKVVLARKTIAEQELAATFFISYNLSSASAHSLFTSFPVLSNVIHGPFSDLAFEDLERLKI